MVTLLLVSFITFSVFQILPGNPAYIILGVDADPMQIEALNTDVDELDFTDTDEVINFGTVNRPDVIINCAAITDVELCEKQPEEAFRVNALGARNLSLVARKTGA